MDRMPGNDPMEKPEPLAGLDPAELLRQGVAEDTILDESSSAFQSPPIEELSPLFPQFEILELIGQGGMGAVYKVRQKDLDRIVALKILPPGIGQSPEFSERFTREARALAKLNHPGIVTLHEFGQQDGLYFILMEFVDGVNLAQLMKTGRVSPREALAIVPQICDALQYAHDQGIVHRDIKPENILLDRQGRVKVADFGIAKVVAAVCDPMRSGDTPVPENQTLAGKIIGTPQYMAPEQIEHPSEVDHRADIYALGVVFYQMLTGELPGRELQAPSRKVSIDVRLDEMVLRALEEKPERRYQTALEFRTVLDGLPPATPRPVPKRGMMRRWWWVFVVMIPLGMLLGFMAAGALTYVMPIKYEAEATVEVVPPNGSAITPAFLGNQCQAIKSSAVLTAVSQELELPNKWMSDGDTAVGILKAIISTQNIRGTDLIAIRVRHTNREDAAGIINAVLRNYQRSFGGKVIVHETPQPPRVPVTPNVTLNLVIGSTVGLLLSPLMALVLILLLHAMFPEKRKEEPRAKRSSAVMIVSIIAVLLVVGLLAGSIGLTALRLQAMAKESHEDAPMLVKELEAGVSRESTSKLADYDWNELAANGRIGDAFKVSVDGRVCLKIENPNDAPMTTRLLTIEEPPIKAMRYAIQGEISYGNVQGRGYLEMWSEFPGGRYFSRTLGNTGPTSVLTGHSGWREFTLPFDRTGTADAPVRIEINLHLPGKGWVFVGPLKLIEFTSETASSRRAGSSPAIMPGESQDRDKTRNELGEAIRAQEAKLERLKKRLEEVVGKEGAVDGVPAIDRRNQAYDAKREVETQEALLGAMKAKWEEVVGIPNRDSPAADRIDKIPSGTLPSSNRLQLRKVAPDDPHAVDVMQIREDGTKVRLKLEDNVIVCDRHVMEVDMRRSNDAYAIGITLNETGEKRLSAATQGAAGRMRLAVLVDGEVKSAPVVMCQLGRQFAVEGFRDQDKCLELVRDLVDWPDDRNTSAMMEWLEKIDQDKAGEAWAMASEYLRQNLSSEKFVEMTAKARQPLGSLETRRLFSAKRMESPPGAPEGLYLVSEFDSSFTNKKEAKELVTLHKEKDGHWRICGYFIR